VGGGGAGQRVCSVGGRDTKICAVWVCRYCMVLMVCGGGAASEVAEAHQWREGARGATRAGAR